MAQIPEPILRRIAAIHLKTEALKAEVDAEIDKIKQMRAEITDAEHRIARTKRDIRVLKVQRQALNFAVRAINGEVVDVKEMVGDIEVVDLGIFDPGIGDIEVVDFGAVVGPPIEPETVAINENTETVTPEPAPVEAVSEPEPSQSGAKLSSIPKREAEQLSSDDVPLRDRIVLAIRKLGAGNTNQIAEMIGKKPQQIGGTLGHLSRENVIQKLPTSGAWALGTATLMRGGELSP